MKRNRAARRRDIDRHGRALGAALDAAARLVDAGGARDVAALAPGALPGALPGNAPLRYLWAPQPRAANADLLPGLRTQRGRTRELASTHPVAVGALGTYLDRVVGTGLALAAAPAASVLGWTEAQAAAWRATVHAEFSLWADSVDCDITGQQTFYQKQRLVAGSRCESGDCFTVLPDGSRSTLVPYALRLQVLEADRVGNPGNKPDGDQVAGGVRVDSNGRPTGYHVYSRHPGAAGGAGAGDRYAGTWLEPFGARSGRRRILHHWQPTRPEQVRGVPWFAPVVGLLKDLDTYSDAELKAAIVSAFFTVFLKTPSGGTAPIYTGEPTASTPSDVTLGAGSVVPLMSGEDVEIADPMRPNPVFEPFFAAVTAQIGMALGLPADLLLKRFNASYSASRAVLLDAWQFLRGQRTWLALSFCQPVYETWLAEAVILGRVQAPGFFADPLLRWAYTRAAWHGDSAGSINPKDEVAAYRDAIDGALMSRERAEWELFGSSFDDTLPQKAREHKALKAADLLPVPRPGAAAAPASGSGAPGGTGDDAGDRQRPGDQAGEPSAQDRAFSLMAGALAALAARENPQPIVTVHPAPIEVRGGDVVVSPQAIELRAGDTTVMLPDGLVQLDARVEAPVVQFTAPAPSVVVQPPRAMRQQINRDANGEITSIESIPINPINP